MVRQGGASPMQDALLRDYDYDAVQTCAGDGSCELACPVGINTGALMKAFRHQEHGRTAEGVAATLARAVPAAGARRAGRPSAPPARRRSSSATAR